MQMSCCLSVVCATLSLLPNVAEARVPLTAKQRVSDATVLIFQGRAAGSGVLIQLPGRPVEVLTAWHCVDEQQPIFVWTTTSSAWHPARVLAHDKDHDLALLQFDHPAPPKPLKIAGRPVAPGESIVTSGWADNWRGKGPGLLEMEAGGTVGHWMLTSTSSRPGRSGGPAINAAGEIVGICYGSRRSNGLYCDLPHIREFVSRRTQPVPLSAGTSWRGRVGTMYVIIVVEERSYAQ